MKKSLFIIIVILILASFSKLFAGDRQELPKTIPTELGVEGKFYEIVSAQLSGSNKDSLSLKFIIAIFATRDAKKELGFGQYELKVSGNNKANIEALIFPFLYNEFAKNN